MVEHDLARENQAEGNGFDGALGTRPFRRRGGSASGQDIKAFDADAYPAGVHA
jgi:hypothetical protein